jgi:RimJ/RimL family protein N-acetyltransferase
LNLQPALKGDLLEIRPLRREDFEALFAVASDPLLWEQHPEPLRYQPEIFKKFFEKVLASESGFVVVDRRTGRAIGSTRYYDYSAEKSEIAIGYTFLARAYWGGIFNREMKRLLIDHAFTSVASVIFHAGRENLRSRKALEKIGAKEEGYIERQFQRPDGTWRGSCVYRIRRPI